MDFLQCGSARRGHVASDPGRPDVPVIVNPYSFDARYIVVEGDFGGALAGLEAQRRAARSARAIAVAALDLIEIKAGANATALAPGMSKERANDLARLCTEAARAGADFQIVWRTLLKGHPLVEGIPRERIVGERRLLDIPLITGERLVFDGNTRTFDLE